MFPYFFTGPIYILCNASESLAEFGGDIVFKYIGFFIRINRFAYSSARNKMSCWYTRFGAPVCLHILLKDQFIFYVMPRNPWLNLEATLSLNVSLSVMSYLNI